MKKYLVKGVCFVPAQAQVTVIARNKVQAMQLANKILSDAPHGTLRNALVAGSVDEGFPFDFAANSAEEASDEQPAA